MSIFKKIAKEYRKHKIYKLFKRAVQDYKDEIIMLDAIHDRELGITRNIIKLAYKYDLPVIVNDTKVAHKQYLSRTWFDYDTKFIKLSDILEDNCEKYGYTWPLPMALCDLDDAGYDTIPDLHELYRCAHTIVGAAKVDLSK